MELFVATVHRINVRAVGNRLPNKEEAMKCVICRQGETYQGNATVTHLLRHVLASPADSRALNKPNGEVPDLMDVGIEASGGAEADFEGGRPLSLIGCSGEVELIDHSAKLSPVPDLYGEALIDDHDPNTASASPRSSLYPPW